MNPVLGSGFKRLACHLYDTESAQALRYARSLTEDLTNEELNWQPRSGHHSLWHHVWHMFLVQDYYRAGAFHRPAVWESGNWAARIDLAGMAAAFAQAGRGNEHIPRFAIMDVPDVLVDDLKAPPLPQYLAYAEQMVAEWKAVLEAATEEQLGRDLISNGRPTTVVRQAIYSGHTFRHLGMMEDLRGLIRGPGQGSATARSG